MMDFQTEVLKHLTEIKSDLGSVKTCSENNSCNIVSQGKRIAWLERFNYGMIAVGITLAILFPHGADALIRIVMDDNSQQHGEQ
jgi:hypothetical protein